VNIVIWTGIADFIHQYEPKFDAPAACYQFGRHLAGGASLR
jgi:hypothetical protein